MTLVELHVDVARVADALEKIAFLLEKLVFPPPPAEVTVRQSTLDDLHTFTPEDQARIQAEQMEFAQRFRVVPGSPAMMQALVDFEDQQRSIHGETWEAPGWQGILAAIERNRGVHQPAEAAAAARQRSPA